MLDCPPVGIIVRSQDVMTVVAIRKPSLNVIGDGVDETLIDNHPEKVFRIMW